MPLFCWIFSALTFLALFHQGPASFRSHSRSVSILQCFCRACVAVQSSFVNALNDARRTEHVVDQIEMPVLNTVSAGVFAVLGEKFGFCWQIQGCEVRSGQTFIIIGIAVIVLTQIA